MASEAEAGIRGRFWPHRSWLASEAEDGLTDQGYTQRPWLASVLRLALQTEADNLLKRALDKYFIGQTKNKKMVLLSH